MSNALVWQYSCNAPIGFSNSAGSEDSASSNGRGRSHHGYGDHPNNVRSGHSAENHEQTAIPNRASTF